MVANLPAGTEKEIGTDLERGLFFEGAHIPGEDARLAQYPLTQRPERTGRL
jgi:hypothetical protein